MTGLQSYKQCRLTYIFIILLRCSILGWRGSLHVKDGIRVNKFKDVTRVLWILNIMSLPPIVRITMARFFVAAVNLRFLSLKSTLLLYPFDIKTRINVMFRLSLHMKFNVLKNGQTMLRKWVKQNGVICFKNYQE